MCVSIIVQLSLLWRSKGESGRAVYLTAKQAVTEE